MDREILFRGKRKSEWFYGDLLTGVYTNQTAQIWYKDEDFGKVNVLVDPSTVGQYTGLTDKNGVKIFEGDVVKHTEDFILERVTSIGVVKWSNGYGSWIISDYTNGRCDMFLGTQNHRLEIIGNIHDNPDLLGGDRP